jgi:hypothetical protein
MNILKQSNLGKFGKWWGAFRNLGQYVAFYITFANFFMIFMTWYVLINPEMQKIGIFIPFFVFAAVMLLGLIIAMVLEHKFTLPNYFTYWNSQWWQHGNPLPKEIDDIKKQLNKIEAKLNE